VGVDPGKGFGMVADEAVAPAAGLDEQELDSVVDEDDVVDD